MPSIHPPSHDRRDFLKAGAGALGAALAGTALDARGQSAAAGAAAAAGPREARFAAPPLDVVRVGFVGIGGMGSVHVRNLLRIPGVRLTAVCDIAEDRVAWAQKATTEAGQASPTGYTRGPRDYERLCREEDLDLVFTATPWEWHVPICVEAMQNGKHAATEVPAAYTLEDCWKLVEQAEKARRHCVMMENCNYDRMELMVLHLVRKGLLGEVLHGECGYLHDLREIKFSDKGEGRWRRAHARTRNGNLYPTHGLGPVAQCMDINRGDRFDYLVSMSGPSRGLQLWAQEHFPPDAPQRREQFVLGDVNVSLIKTAGGRTIYVSHDTNLPRPYSRIHLLQGTRGLFQGYPSRLSIEGRGEPHRWEDANAAVKEFEHPLWAALGGSSQNIGHGGMDYIEDYRLIHCLRHGLPMDMDVYDAAALSAVCALTEQSVAKRSAPVDFPDFTRGRWQRWAPMDIVSTAVAAP